MTKLFALAVPILPGKTEQFKNFIAELNGSRSREFKESRKKLNIRERTFFQSTPMGDMIVVTLEGQEPEKALQQFAQQQGSFTSWFVQQVTEIHGLDLNHVDQRMMPELMIDSQNVMEPELAM